MKFLPLLAALLALPQTVVASGICVCNEHGRERAGEHCGCSDITSHGVCKRQSWCRWQHVNGNNQAAGLIPSGGASGAGAEEDIVDFESYWIAGGWPTFVAWTAFVIVTFMTSRNAYRHLLSYSRPDLQPHVLRIIMVGPIYTFSAALCLSMHEEGCFFIRALRDIWEAIVIYSFLTLIVEYMGGEHLCLDGMAQGRDEAVPHLFPLNLCLSPLPMGQMIRIPKIGVLQFVIVKPFLAALSCVAYAVGEFETAFYQYSLLVIYNISYSVALYALYLVYWASHHHPSLQAKRPLLKFISVKMIVFLTFWQALVIPMLPLPGSTVRWEDFVLAFEMIVFGFLMNTAFSWKEFHSGLRGTDELPVHLGGGKAVSVDHFNKGSHPAQGQLEPTAQPSASGQPSSTPIGRREVVQNAKAAMNPKDIINDASASFSRRYQQHVLIESAQEYELQEREKRPHSSPKKADATATAGAGQAGHANPLRTFRARTYLLGRSLAPAGSTQLDEKPPEVLEAGAESSGTAPPALSSAELAAELRAAAAAPAPTVQAVQIPAPAPPDVQGNAV